MATEIEGRPGEWVKEAAARAVAEAKTDGEPRILIFNSARLAVEAHSTADEICAAYDAFCEEQHKAYMASERVAEREREAAIKEEKRRQEFAALVETVKAADEKALRESPDPWPYSMDELTAYVKALNERQHGYGTCVYAMSLSAVAAFNYTAHSLGTTGFQSSCADLDILRRTRSLKGGFQIVDFDKLLYPQCINEDNFPTVQTLLHKHRDELAKRAQEHLNDSADAHPNVVAHWKRLAEASTENR